MRTAVGFAAWFLLLGTAAFAGEGAGGTVWSGTRIVNGSIEQACKLTIKEVKETSFKGELEIVARGTHAYPVTGSLPAEGDGKVSFKTDPRSKGKKADRLSQAFTGDLKGSE